MTENPTAPAAPPAPAPAAAPTAPAAAPTAPGAAVQRMLGMVIGAWAGAAVHAAVTLELPEHLAAGTGAVADLAAATGTEPEALRRLLDYLVALEVCAGDPAAGYRLTDVGEVLRPGVPGSVRDYVRLVGEEFYPVWPHLADTVRTGRPSFARVHGSDLYDYMAANPSAGRRFDTAMNSGRVLFERIPLVYDFAHCAEVVDVGGGNGELLAEILLRHPGTRGLLVDLPETVGPAADYLAGRGVAERCRTEAGDMFRQVPSGGDAYLLSRVVVNLDDERAAEVMANCAAGMKPGAVLLLVERPRSEGVPTPVAAAIDVLMMLITDGGRSRTTTELDRLTRSAGLVPEGSLELPQGFRLFVARKP
jgi:hypothetical protein